MDSLEWTTVVAMLRLTVDERTVARLCCDDLGRASVSNCDGMETNINQTNKETVGSFTVT